MRGSRNELNSKPGKFQLVVNDLIILRYLIWGTRMNNQSPVKTGVRIRLVGWTRWPASPQLTCTLPLSAQQVIKMNNGLHSFYLIAVLHSTKGFFKTALAETTQRSENNIIKDCNGILYRLMIDAGEPPFPATACDIKQVGGPSLSRMPRWCLISVLAKANDLLQRPVYNIN